jgi:hypothetical protein
MTDKFERFKNQINELQKSENPFVPRIISIEQQSPEMIEKLVYGFRQLIEGKGYSMDSPFENIGIEGFYLLMDVFHCVVVAQGVVKSNSNLFLDEMLVQDVVTSDRVLLYNHVKDIE